jgi:G protein-coupled glucose receptor regulating Gpa2
MAATFNEVQSRALAIVPKISGTLSVLFSLLIIVIISRDKNRHSRTYHRLLLSISMVDMSSGFWLSLSTWPIPSDSTVLWSVGNDRTCTVQGFFTNFAITSSFYHTSLALYFLLVVRYGWKEHQIQKIEPYLLVIPLLWGFGTSIAGLGLGIFGNAILWCWIERTYNMYRWAFFYGPLWTMIVLVTIMSILIFQHVLKLERTTMKYQQDVEKQFISQYPNLSDKYKISDQNVHSREGSTDAMDQATCSVDEIAIANDTLSGDTSSPYPSTDSQTIAMESRGLDDVRTDVHVSTNIEKPHETSFPLSQQQPCPQGILRRLSSHRLFHQDDDTVVRFKHTKEVATQCFWYTGAFYINWVALSVRIIIHICNISPLCREQG